MIVYGELIEWRSLVRSTHRVVVIAKRAGSAMSAFASVAKPAFAERVL